ncbi:MAG: peptidoglycan DD-metalloendopeptidase family protein [Anaerolineales bacterium]
MKPRLLISALFLLAALALAGAAFAQEEEPDGPVYVIREGDTLSSIALRFGVTVNDLLEANNMDISDLLFISDLIVIPGLEGITGVLETQTIPFGESMRSLSRRRQIPIDKLVKLNRLVSPAELYTGASLILPRVAREERQTSRTVLAPGQTLLELAVLEGANPWRLTGFNHIEGPTRTLPGDVLFTPDKPLDGPGAFPAPVTGIQVSDFYQGETGSIRIQAGGGLTLRGVMGPYQFDFFPDGEGGYAALQGIHALAETGLYLLTIEGELANGAVFSHAQLVHVNPRGYIFEYINVPPELIDPEITQAEWEFIKPMAGQVTPERLWEGLFLAPSPFADCINSSFGNRRSYNGSAFVYFHSGVDFCGGTGVEITAPAPGIVVFAGPLEVRGNLTLIDHGWGVFTAYLHQSEIFVRKGERVEPGQVIGLIGNTGRSTGAHLHWEVWVGGVQVNPLDWLATPHPHP